MSGTLPWYVARASGLVAWALLAGAVVWGLLMTSKLMRRRVKNSWLLDLHRWLGGLALVFTGIHVVAIMGDSYVHFGLASVLVPLAAHWHPLAVAWGVASLYLLAAVELTSLLRRRLSNRLWKRVHLLSFPLFVTSTVHGLSAGTDGRTPMAIITAALVTAAVGALVAVRIRRTPDRPAAAARAEAPDRPAAPAAAAAAAPPPRPRPPREGVLVGSAGDRR
jgi:DMSO/TMAO reductase YedYZ heme-binding membrane subunit